MTTIVHEPTLEGRTMSAAIEVAGERHRVSVTLPHGPISFTSDGFLAISLTPAMTRPERLRVEGEVSARFLGALPRIQGFLSEWDRRLKPVTVEATAVSRRPTPGPRGSACFFSGGVDSFHTVLRHQDELSGLIFLHGFDLHLAEKDRRAEVADGLRRAAAELGKEWVEVELDVRDFADRFVDRKVWHGAALAMVAHLLAARFDKVYIAATNSPSVNPTWGSHPDLDPLWSTEQVELVHDGFETERLDKLRAIARSEVGVRWLRVCHARGGTGYNCGRCEKCVRTMVSLRALGVLDRTPAFPQPLEPAAIDALTAEGHYQLPFWRQNLVLLESSDQAPEPELIQAVRRMIARSVRARRPTARLRRRLARVGR